MSQWQHMGEHKVPRRSCNSSSSGLENIRTRPLLDEGAYSPLQISGERPALRQGLRALGTRVRVLLERWTDGESSSSSDGDEEGTGREDADSDSRYSSAAASSSASPSSLGHASCQGPSPPCSPSACSPSPLLCPYLPHLGGTGQKRRSQGTYIFF